MVGHLFCQISADVVLQYSDTHLPQKDGTLSSQLMMHSGGYVRTVCGKWHGRQINYSSLQHCTPLRLSNEGGLSTRGRQSPFILTWYRWGKIKCITEWEECVSAQRDPRLVWQLPAVFDFCGKI